MLGLCVLLYRITTKFKTENNRKLFLHKYSYFSLFFSNIKETTRKIKNDFNGSPTIDPICYNNTFVSLIN